MKNRFIRTIQLTYSVFLLGFFLHTSQIQPVVFGKYSWFYFLGLLSATVFLFVLPPILRYITRTSVYKLRAKKKIYISQKIKIVFTCMLLISIAIFLENYLRTLHIRINDYPYNFTIDNYHPFLQHRMSKENNTYNQELHLNNFGFRGEDITDKKDKDEFRIFVIGGSTVFNATIKYEDTFTKILENKLKSTYPDKKIHIYNAGVDGYTTEHAVIQYLFSIRELKPDLIITWHGINDMYYSCTPPILSHGKYRDDYSHFLGSTANMVTSYFSNRLRLPSSTLVDYIFHFFGSSFLSDLKSSKNVAVSFGQSQQSDSFQFPSVNPFKRNLTYFVQAVQSDRTSLLLTSQPYLYTPLYAKDTSKRWFMQQNCNNGKTYPSILALLKGISLFNNTSQEVALQNNVHFLDLAASLPKTTNYFIDDVHFTVEGNKKVANTLYDYIMQEQIVE